jgi:hypothetical protein
MKFDLNDPVVQGNRLIAVFMGMKFIPKSKWYHFTWNSYSCDVFKPNKGSIAFADWHLHYHDSWNWLMPVAHTILFNKGFNENCYNNIIAIQQALGNCEISGVHSEIVEFIKTYNNENNRS